MLWNTQNTRSIICGTGVDSPPARADFAQLPAPFPRFSGGILKLHGVWGGICTMKTGKMLEIGATSFISETQLLNFTDTEWKTARKNAHWRISRSRGCSLGEGEWQRTLQLCSPKSKGPGLSPKKITFSKESLQDNMYVWFHFCKTCVYMNIYMYIYIHESIMHILCVKRFMRA